MNDRRTKRARRQLMRAQQLIGGRLKHAIGGAPQLILRLGPELASVVFFGSHNNFRLFVPYPGHTQERYDFYSIQALAEFVWGAEAIRSEKESHDADSVDLGNQFAVEGVSAG